MYGGEVVGQGSVTQLSKAKKSTTGQYLNGSLSISTPKSRRKGNGNSIIIKGAKENNLKNIDLKIPLGKLVCVTGVSGSGKSSLINQVLYQSVSNQLLGNKEVFTNSDGVFNLEHLDKVIKIAVGAGDVVLEEYNRKDFNNFESKKDGSPLTEADKKSSNFIVQELKKINNEIPIITEELQIPSWEKRKKYTKK